MNAQPTDSLSEHREAGASRSPGSMVLVEVREFGFARGSSEWEGLAGFGLEHDRSHFLKDVSDHCGRVVGRGMRGELRED